jgi:PIN domain nuclease of toxin-antitoxin system
VILLDTHAFVWLASEPGVLSEPVRTLISRHPAALYLSSVSAWEIVMLNKRGRLELPLPAEEYIERALFRHGIHELPLNRYTAQASVRLPDIHNDPFDRILIAEALERGMLLVSKDQTIARYPDVRVIW